MSKFHEHFNKLDEIARAAFSEYREATDRLARAEDQRRQYPHRSGAVTADYAATSARAQADYLEAVQEKSRVQRKMDEGEFRRQITELRKQLAAAVGDAYRVNPEQIDNNTLELLRSGIMTPDEYGALLNKAADSGNITMVRLIGKYATDAAAAAVDAAGGYMSDPTATALRSVGYQAKKYNGSAWLEAFDTVTDVYNRACRNPGMMDKWDDLTGPIMEQM